jgi:SH3 domain
MGCCQSKKVTESKPKSSKGHNDTDTDVQRYSATPSHNIYDDPEAPIETVDKYVALYDYEGRTSGELSFNEKDELTITDKSNVTKFSIRLENLFQFFSYYFSERLVVCS